MMSRDKIIEILKQKWYLDCLVYNIPVSPSDIKDVLEDLIPNESKKTVKLNISMGYTFVGNTGIDIPIELLEGKTESEKYDIAYNYARDHIDEIPVAKNAEYIENSDQFDIDDIEFEEEVE